MSKKISVESIRVELGVKLISISDGRTYGHYGITETASLLHMKIITIQWNTVVYFISNMKSYKMSF